MPSLRPNRKLVVASRIFAIWTPALYFSFRQTYVITFKHRVFRYKVLRLIYLSKFIQLIKFIMYVSRAYFAQQIVRCCGQKRLLKSGLFLVNDMQQTPSPPFSEVARKNISCHIFFFSTFFFLK